MDVQLIFKIAAVGIIVVLMIVAQKIAQLFDLVQSLFRF